VDLGDQPTTGLPNAQRVLLVKANPRGVGTKLTHTPESGRIGIRNGWGSLTKIGGRPLASDRLLISVNGRSRTEL
jgi:hypothetical protein